MAISEILIFLDNFQTNYDINLMPSASSSFMVQKAHYEGQTVMGILLLGVIIFWES